jgi:ketosteroid isomerase-like protein
VSQENFEIVRSFYRPGDPSRFFDLLHDQVQIDASEVSLLPDQPKLTSGKEAVVDFFRRYWTTWHDYSLEPVEIIDGRQDRVVVVHDERGTGKRGGVPFERSWAVVYTFNAGQLMKIQQFPGREQALEAAGLSE